MKTIDRLCERANKRTNKLLAKVESEELKSEAKIESEKIRSINNSRNLPNCATIRKEYVRCGKLDCPSKHGPYYYACWKDDCGKLKKKYIGKYPPSINKHKSHDMTQLILRTTEDVRAIAELHKGNRFSTKEKTKRAQNERD
jgi:hypothetical protein